MTSKNVRFELAGTRAREGADRLAAALGVDPWAITLPTPDPSAGPTERIIDPVSVAALVLSIPGAILAVLDLADRIAKRHKAQRVLDTAKRIGVELNVETRVTGPDGRTHAVASLTADALLDLAAARQG